MRHLILTFLFLQTVAAAGQWLALGNAPASADFAGIWATSSSAAVAMSSNGNFYKTTNGGNTWTLQPNLGGTSNLLRDITFTDAQNGFAVGNSDFFFPTVYRTSDGGSTWTVALKGQQGAGSVFNRVVFPTAQVGYVIGTAGAIFKTTNGGAAWSPLNLGTTAELRDISFVDAQHGFVTTSNVLFRTSDGGATWQGFPLPISQRYIRFFTAQHGYVLQFDRLIETSDGGATWQDIALLPAAPSSYFFANPQKGWIGSPTGEIFQTTDGGKTWLLQSQGDGNPIRDLHFANGVGWAVAPNLAGNSKIAKTSNDGGFGMALRGSSLGVCPGDFLQLHCQHAGAISFSWKINDQLVAGNNSPNLAVGPVNGGEYVVACTADFGNGYSLTQEKIYGIPDFLGSFSVELQQDSFCQGGRARFRISQISPDIEYSIRVGSTVLWDTMVWNFALFGLNWESGSLDQPTVFEFWAKFSGCGGSRKLLEVPVHTRPIPKTDLAMSLVKNPICENTAAEIGLANSEAGVSYQIFAAGQPSGSFFQGKFLKSQPLAESQFLKIKAASSSVCFQFLKDSVGVGVMQVEPFFGVNSQNPALGLPLVFTNGSADSLAFQWTFDFGGNASFFTGKTPPNYLPTAVGKGLVKMLATTPAGCRDSLVVAVEVYDPAGLGEFWVFSTGKNLTNLFLPDAEGSIYAAGASFGGGINSRRPTSLPDGTEKGAYFYKYDKRGVLQWVNRFRAEGDTSSFAVRVKDLATDASGNFYLLMDLGYEPGSFVLTSTDGREFVSTRNRSILLAKYSKSGVLLGTASVHNTCGLTSNARLEGISISVDSSGFLFLAGKMEADCPELALADMTGNESVETLDGAVFFVAKLTFDAEPIWVKSHEFGYAAPNILNHAFRPVQVAADRLGGCYVWSSGGPDDASPTSSAVHLARFLPDGEVAWEQMGRIGQLNDDREHIYANELVVDIWGNAIVSGSVFGGPVQLFSQANFQNYKGNFLGKFSPSGKVLWTQLFESAHQTNAPEHLNLGLAAEGDRIFTRVESGFNDHFLHAFGICFDSVFADKSEFILVWDSLGNLLEIIPSNFASVSGIDLPSQIFRTIRVRNGIVYACGRVENSAAVLSDFSMDLNSNFQFYLGRVPDPKRYFPYISMVNHGFSYQNCYSSRCETDSSRQLRVSYLFKNIVWKKDGIALGGGYNVPAILPPAKGLYLATGINPAGATATTPHAVVVQETYPNPMPIIAQVGNALMTESLVGAAYYWYDSTGTLVHFAYQNGSFTPKNAGKYWVKVVSTNNCEGESLPFFFQTVAAGVPDAADFSLKIFPNPARRSARVACSVPPSLDFEIVVCDVLGRRRTVLRPVSAGIFELDAEKMGLAGGVYQVRLVADGRLLAFENLVLVE